jgi:hypothetical protein
MNGRVYDYNLGRFLSVDPFIQDPGNSQSMNPYSYIMNNPLSGTDPTGYNILCTGGSSVPDRMACGSLGGVSQATIQKSMTHTSGLNTAMQEFNGGGSSWQFNGSSSSGNGWNVDNVGRTGRVIVTESVDMGSQQQVSQRRNRQSNGKKSTLTKVERIKLMTTEVDKIQSTVMGKAYKDINKLAMDIHNAFNPLSIKYDLEIGLSLYEGDIGMKDKVFAANLRIEEDNYTSGGASIDGEVNLTYGNGNFSLAGDWHSHGSAMSAFTFSTNDYVHSFTTFFDNYTQKGGYYGFKSFRGSFMSNAQGKLRFFDPIDFTKNHLNGRSDFESIPHGDYFKSDKEIK